MTIYIYIYDGEIRGRAVLLRMGFPPRERSAPANSRERTDGKVEMNGRRAGMILNFRAAGLNIAFTVVLLIMQIISRDSLARSLVVILRARRIAACASHDVYTRT